MAQPNRAETGRTDGTPGTQHTTNTTSTAGHTTDAGNPTQANYNAEAVRVSPTGTKTAETHRDSSSTKGLVVGVLTFLLLSLWEWLDGATGAAGDAITFVEMLIYAIVGIVVGVVVKMIDKSRAKTDKV